MRSAGWIIAALVAGFLLGGVQPRRELADTEGEMDALREALEDAEKRASKTSRTQLFNLPGVGDFDFGDDDGDDGDIGDEDERADSRRGDRAPDDVGEDLDDEGGGFDDERRTADNIPLDELDLAVDAQRLRASQSRAALIETLALSDAEVEEFDAIVLDMNDRIAGIADDAAFIMLSGEEPTPSEMLALSHDATGILYDAQQDMEDLVGPEGLADLDENTAAAWNYMDLGSLRDATLDLAEDME